MGGDVGEVSDIDAKQAHSDNRAKPQAAIAMVEVHGVAMHALSEEQTNAHVLDEIEAGRGGWVVTANLDHLRRLVRDPSYGELCEGADLIVADGMPLIWASRIAGTPLPERVAGSSLVSTLSEQAGRRGRSVYLLGAQDGVAEAAAKVLDQRCAGLKIAGVYSPPYGFAHEGEEMRKIERLLDRARPDIVYVALGSPKQELLINQLRDRLPGAWWVGVGISFSYLTGDVRRAPRWVRATGLEWAYRLFQEPRRLFKRYLVQGVPFGLWLLLRALIGRLRPQRRARLADYG